MNIKRKFARGSTLLVLTHLLLACTKTVEVPRDRVAAIIDLAGVKKEILTEGTHQVASSYDIVFFDVSPKQVAFSCEFILNDATLGNLNCLVIYQPLAEKMPGFLRRYKTDNLERVIIPELRTTIRKMFELYSRADIDDERISIMIANELAKKEGILRFIEVKEIANVEVTFD